jgi:hypothetical protein
LYGREGLVLRTDAEEHLGGVGRDDGEEANGDQPIKAAVQAQHILGSTQERHSTIHCTSHPDGTRNRRLTETSHAHGMQLITCLSACVGSKPLPV